MSASAQNYVYVVKMRKGEKVEEARLTEKKAEEAKKAILPYLGKGFEFIKR